MLHHVEAQFFGLAGEHLHELDEVEIEHELQVLAGQLLAILGGGLAAGGGFAGGVDRDPGCLEVRGGGDERRAEIGLMGGDGGDEGLQMHLHLIIAAGAEDAATARHALGHLRGTIAIVGDDGSDELRHSGGQGGAEVVLGLLARHAQAEFPLVIGHAVLNLRQRLAGGGDAGGELAPAVVGGHPFQMIRGEGDELGDADVLVVEGIVEEA